ncbi:hypothetical protein QTO34_019101 [Cnephaeus nilssonii]|uniref:Solute carrier family 2, facilitated glucose transporter member 5 n=1 Tax=Cnephaeus nilssonii TaxID=3371016 RepID=A0AA40LNL3_CNENI|nr:hypothetical protein QTO34_019101 [Eptesicus nilssonii]
MEVPSPPREGRLRPTLVLATLSAAFGSAFQYGYNIAVVNTPHKVGAGPRGCRPLQVRSRAAQSSGLRWGHVLQVLKSFYNDTYFARHGTPMDEKQLLLLWSCTVAMFPLGGLLGSLLVGGLVDKCGRKGTLLINNIFAIVPAILMGVSKVAKAFELIILSRVLLGVCADGEDIGIMPCRHLLQCPPHVPGRAGSQEPQGHSGNNDEVFVIVGVFLAQIFSLQAILGNPTGWPVLLALTGVPALLQLLSLPFFPESPRYTLIQRGDEDAARQALRKLRGWADVEDEIAEMRVEDAAERAEGRLSVLNLFTFRPLRWQLISIIVLMAGQQLSGVNAINYYADTIYASAGVAAAHSQYVTVGAGVVNIVMTGVSAGTVEWLGRRLLLLVGYGICGSACLVLTLALLFQSAASGLSYLGVICVFSYIAGHSIGPSEYPPPAPRPGAGHRRIRECLRGPVPSVVRTEIFLQSSRPAAFMVDGAVHWLTNFIVGFMFPSVQEAIGAYSFIPFAGICLLTAVYIYVVIPETKGQTFVEINRVFAKRNGVEIPELEEEATGAEPPASPPAKETSF